MEPQKHRRLLEQFLDRSALDQRILLAQGGILTGILTQWAQEAHRGLEPMACELFLHALGRVADTPTLPIEVVVEIYQNILKVFPSTTRVSNVADPYLHVLRRISEEMALSPGRGRMIHRRPARNFNEAEGLVWELFEAFEERMGALLPEEKRLLRK